MGAVPPLCCRPPCFLLPVCEEKCEAPWTLSPHGEVCRGWGAQLAQRTAPTGVVTVGTVTPGMGQWG